MPGLDWLLGSSISSSMVPTPVASMVLLSPKKMVNGEMALKVVNHSRWYVMWHDAPESTIQMFLVCFALMNAVTKA